MTHRIVVCMGSSCFARGNEKNIAVIQQFLQKYGIAADVELSGARCQTQCSRGPNIIIDGTIYNRMDSEALLDVLRRKFLPGK